MLLEPSPPYKVFSPTPYLSARAPLSNGLSTSLLDPALTLGSQNGRLIIIASGDDRIPSTWSDPFEDVIENQESWIAASQTSQDPGLDGKGWEDIASLCKSRKILPSCVILNGEAGEPDQTADSCKQQLRLFWELVSDKGMPGMLMTGDRRPVR